MSNLPTCPTQLSDDQLAHFKRDGYLAFVDALSPEEVEQARSTLSELFERLAHDESTQTESNVWVASDSRFRIQFEDGYVPNTKDEHGLELKIRKLFWFVEAHDFFGELATSHPRLSGVLQSILGADPILFQDMALVKPPFIGGEKPWHQDDAYFTVEPLDSICGIWIALDEATVENGCMHVIPGGHLDGPKIHVHARDCEIETERLDLSRVIPVPLPAGGAMFFHGLLPHQTPPNQSPDRRRALQFHYHRQDSHVISKEEYSQIFAENGVPASCAFAERRA
jgi:phytanoyl-CoA hydroxylase